MAMETGSENCITRGARLRVKRVLRVGFVGSVCVLVVRL